MRQSCGRGSCLPGAVTVSGEAVPLSADEWQLSWIDGVCLNSLASSAGAWGTPVAQKWVSDQGERRSLHRCHANSSALQLRQCGWLYFVAVTPSFPGSRLWLSCFRIFRFLHHRTGREENRANATHAVTILSCSPLSCSQLGTDNGHNCM